MAHLPEVHPDFAPIWHFIIIAVVGGTTGALITIGLEWWLR